MLIMFHFGSLKNKNKPVKEEETFKLSKIREAKDALKRIFTNPIWVFDSLAGICRFIGYAGYCKQN